MTPRFRSIPLMLAVLFAGMFVLSGCFRDRCNLEYRYMEYSPVYMDTEDFYNAVKVEAPGDLRRPGKILVHGDYLFVSEMAKGIHVINNENPSAPVILAYIAVPGNYDLASDCDVLYADSGPDLLVFDISNPAAPVLLRRVANALPAISEYRGYVADPNEGIVVEWVGIEKTGKIDDCHSGPPTLWTMNQVPADAPDGSTFRTSTATPGQAGSMSRFALVKKHLYVVTPNELQVFNTANCIQPVQELNIKLENHLMWGGIAETIFASEELLFIGTESNMIVFNNQNPDAPFVISTFEHATACDPVIADKTHAFITLRQARLRCWGWSNQLDIVNIENPNIPRHNGTILLDNPHGLGKDGNLLFVCEGDQGFKVFDIKDADAANLEEIAHINQWNGFDVIPVDGTLVLTGEDGIAMYDYQNPNDIRQLSTIPVVQ